MLHHIITVALVAAAGVSAVIPIPSQLSAVCSNVSAFQSCAATAVTSTPSCLATIDPRNQAQALPCVCQVLGSASGCIKSACGAKAAGVASIACAAVSTTTTATATATATSGATTGATSGNQSSKPTGTASQTTGTSASLTTKRVTGGAPTPIAVMASGAAAALFAGAVALL